MAASSGRKLFLTKNSQIVGGLRETSSSIQGSPIDITTMEDNGYRTLLDEVGEKMIDLNISGILKDTILKDLTLDGSSLLLTDIEVVYPDGTKLGGDFFISNYETAGTYNDAITFTGTLVSSGSSTTQVCTVELVGTVPDQVAQVGNPFSLDMSQYFALVCSGGYTAPALSSSPSSAYTVTGLNIQVATPTSNSTVRTQNTVILMDSSDVYVYQFRIDAALTTLLRHRFIDVNVDVGIPTGANEVSFDMNDSTPRFLSNFSGSITTQSISRVLEGTCVLDTAAKTMSIYNTSGVLVGSFNYGGTLAGGYYFQAFAQQQPTASATWDYYFDKNTFPYTLPSGLPVDYKQLGES